MMADDSQLLLNYHLFRVAGECPVKLFYHREGRYPDFGRDDPFKKHLRRNKKLLIRCLQQQMPGGPFAGPSSPPDQQARRTGQLLREGHDTIYDARLEAGGCTIRVPVLQRSDSQVTLYQVECRTFDPANHHLMDHRGKISKRWYGYIQKMAFKVVVARWALPDCTINPVLVLPRKNFRADDGQWTTWVEMAAADIQSEYENDENHSLLVHLDPSKAVDMLLHPSTGKERAGIEERIGKALALLEQKERPEPVVGVKCSTCEFRPDRAEDHQKPNGFDACWQPMKQADCDRHNQPVINLVGTDGTEWLKQDIYWLADVPERITQTHYNRLVNGRGRISMRDRQHLQIEQAAGRDVPEEIIKGSLRRTIREWNWPLHFLDFEAASFPLPLRSGGYPFEPTMFQFSCHTLYRDGTLQHRDFIHPELRPHPNYEVARALLEMPDIPNGTVIQYSPFEKQAIKIIKRQLRSEHAGPDDAASLYDGLFQLLADGPDWVDMSRLVRDYYYNEYMNGSLGVKEVVQSMFRFSPVLRRQYDRPFATRHWGEVQFWNGEGQGGSITGPYAHSGLDGEIGQGTEALWAFGRMQFDDLEAGERDKLRRALLRYCELDTLAMVMIYQHWMGQLSESRDDVLIKTMEMKP